MSNAIEPAARPFVVEGAISVETEIGGRTLRLETGKIARLATSCVLATYGGTTVMAAVVRANPRPGLDFFPLQIDYRERTSAAGKFPGGFRKREGAPNEKEILTMRMIDRPIRPLFPEGFIDEVQVQCWVMSHDTENDSDIVACNAAAAALMISSAPFEGPLGTVRIGRIHTDDGPQFVVNPTVTQLEYSDMDLVVSGHRDGVNMIELGAAQVADEDVLAGIAFAYEQIKLVLDLQDKLVRKVKPAKTLGELSLPDEDIVATVKKHCEKPLTAARKISGKQERSQKIDELRTAFLDEHFPEKTDGTVAEWETSKRRRAMAKEAFRTLEKKITRKLIVEKGVRADGRGFKEIRPVEMQVGVFERTHGSAFFQRGETQSLVTCTLGNAKDEQIVDGLLPEYSKKFYLHYNFPPFCVGEAGRITGPGRREIGHGALAERSLQGILPDPSDFAYTVRLVSDITESNGSSSMASVTGGCLALMDAGVPITATCAGISVGRFTDDKGNIVHVTDIIGEEDFFGDMDFKISGTREGITGIQLDLKARGLDLDEIKVIFAQAREGRLELIDKMEQVLPGPRPEISRFAPRLVSIQINPEKIGKLIGPGGKTIRGLQEKWGVSIDVEDSGIAMISGTNAEAVEGCIAEVEALAADIKVGTIFHGTVVSMKDFGCFVELVPGTDGMCHISELKDGFVKSVSEVVKVGDVIPVKVINVDDQGRIKLSRKAALAEIEGKPLSEPSSDADSGESSDRGDRNGRGRKRGRGGRDGEERSERQNDRNGERGDRSDRNGKDRDRDRDRGRGKDKGRDDRNRDDRRKPEPAPVAEEALDEYVEYIEYVEYVEDGGDEYEWEYVDEGDE
jgi:polyribonucleotide nucleotidyltransferase